MTKIRQGRRGHQLILIRGYDDATGSHFRDDTLLSAATIQMWEGFRKAAKKPETAQPVHDDFDFEQYSAPVIDINLLMSDQSLQQELLDLGWEHEVPFLSPSSAPPIKNTAVTSCKVATPSSLLEPEALLHVSSLDDGSTLAFDEQDMNDPELLGMYESLQEDEDLGTSQQRYDLLDFTESITEPKTKPLLQQQPPTTILTSSSIEVVEDNEPGPTSLDVEEMKARALKYKREGNNAEALRWYRYVKQMEQARIPPAKPAKLITTIALPSTVSVDKGVVSPVPLVKAASDAGASNGTVQYMPHKSNYETIMLAN